METKGGLTASENVSNDDDKLKQKTFDDVNTQQQQYGIFEAMSPMDEALKPKTVKETPIPSIPYTIPNDDIDKKIDTVEEETTKDKEKVNKNPSNIPSSMIPSSPLHIPGRWSEIEKLVFLHNVKTHGNGQWKRIAQEMPTR